MWKFLHENPSPSCQTLNISNKSSQGVGKCLAKKQIVCNPENGLEKLYASVQIAQSVRALDQISFVLYLCSHLNGNKDNILLAYAYLSVSASLLGRLTKVLAPKFTGNLVNG